MLWLFFLSAALTGCQSEDTIAHAQDLKQIWNAAELAVQEISPATSYGPADGINQKINDTINEIADALKDPILFEHVSIGPGKLEFGEINLQLYDGQLIGLGNMVAENISFTLIPTALNLTLYFKRIEIESKKYTIEGNMLFPMGNQIIELTGTGAMSGAITDLYISVTATIGIVAAKKPAIKKLDMYASADNIELNFENFMDDDELSWAFNQVFNDAGITAFNYYKDDLLAGLNEPVKELLNKLIQQLLPGLQA